MNSSKVPKLEAKPRLLLLSFFKKHHYDNQLPTDDPFTVMAREDPFYFLDGDYFPRFLLVSDPCMNTLVEDYDSEENYIKFTWNAYRGFYFYRGEVMVIPTDSSAALLMLRLAKITRIDMGIFNHYESYRPTSLQKWIKACTALKRESIFTV
jgi:hypothetical protein